MPQTSISVQMDSKLKTEAQAVLAGLGFDMSTEISKPAVKRAKLGGWEGKILMSDDFNAPMEEFREYVE